MTTDQWRQVEQVAGWLAMGKRVQIKGTPDREFYPFVVLDKLQDFVSEGGWQFRLAPEPATRAFTAEEARILVGLVLVSPDGQESTCQYSGATGAHWRFGQDPSFKVMHDKHWQYRLPGSMDLLPCWKEESGR